VSPRAVLDAVVKRKIPSPRRESKHRTPIVQPLTQRLLFSFKLKVKVKVKVKLALCLTDHHALKMYWGVEVLRHAFWTSNMKFVTFQILKWSFF